MAMNYLNGDTFKESTFTSVTVSYKIWKSEGTNRANTLELLRFA